jgi:protein-S-isoprenylcysteine O-methyltransferase Ste14
LSLDKIRETFNSDLSQEDLGKKFFEWRDYTPIPLIIVLLFAAKPTVLSATLGTLIIVLGELIRVYSVAFIGSISRTRSDNLGGNLVTAGPFAIVRNPLYVGNLFITSGVVIHGGALWLILLTWALFGVQYFYIVKYEEGNLLKKFGAEYQKYMAEVPAFIPKKLPKLADIAWPESFSPALKSERRTLTAIVCMLLVLVLLSF